jgi:hypothetical protein
MNMKNMRINTLLLLSVCLLIRCANNGSNTENNIVVNIKGPTNCDYTLSVHSKNLSVIGASLNYLELDSIIVPGDTTKYHFDTIMNISDLNKLSRIIDELQLYVFKLIWTTSMFNFRWYSEVHIKDSSIFLISLFCLYLK